MFDKHTLGRVKVKAGELVTFSYDDKSPANKQRVTVVALSDFDMSSEMALFYESLDRSTDAILTENAIPAFVEWLCEKRLLHVSTEVTVHFGTMGRPASRLVDEYKFHRRPEEFWEEKLTHRYMKYPITIYNHQEHLITVMMDVDAPFTVLADIISLEGDHLGILQFSVLTANRHTTLSSDDLEVIRSALQADMSLHVQDVGVLVDRITLIINPNYGVNGFMKHLELINPSEQKPLNQRDKQWKQ